MHVSNYITSSYITVLVLDLAHKSNGVCRASVKLVISLLNGLLVVSAKWLLVKGLYASFCCLWVAMGVPIIVAWRLLRGINLIYLIYKKLFI